MKVRIHPPRCQHVLAVLNNQLETVELLREEVHPPVGDFPEAAMEVAVVRWRGWEVYIPLGSVVFQQTHKDIEMLHAQVVESARKMTAAEGMAFLVRAGIYTPGGQLTPEYGGPNQKLPPEVESMLQFISENMRISGFSGKIDPETVRHMMRLYRAGRLRRKGLRVIPAPKWLIQRMQKLREMPPPTSAEVATHLEASEKFRKKLLASPSSTKRRRDIGTKKL